MLMAKVDAVKWVLSTQAISGEERRLIESTLHWHRSGLEIELDREIGLEFSTPVLQALKLPPTWEIRS